MNAYRSIAAALIATSICGAASFARNSWDAVTSDFDEVFNHLSRVEQEELRDAIRGSGKRQPTITWPGVNWQDHDGTVFNCELSFVTCKLKQDWLHISDSPDTKEIAALEGQEVVQYLQAQFKAELGHLSATRQRQELVATWRRIDAAPLSEKEREEQLRSLDQPAIDVDEHIGRLVRLFVWGVTVESKITVLVNGDGTPVLARSVFPDGRKSFYRHLGDSWERIDIGSLGQDRTPFSGDDVGGVIKNLTAMGVRVTECDGRSYLGWQATTGKYHAGIVTFHCISTPQRIDDPRASVDVALPIRIANNEWHGRVAKHWGRNGFGDALMSVYGRRVARLGGEWDEKVEIWIYRTTGERGKASTEIQFRTQWTEHRE